MISKDPYYHVLKLSGQYGYFWLSYKGVIEVGDHGHDRSRQGDVSLDPLILS